MRGHFELAPYRNLDAEQIRFLETFLRCRGVIRDVEAALGISYPTVRARLDALLNALGFADGPPRQLRRPLRADDGGAEGGAAQGDLDRDPERHDGCRRRPDRLARLFRRHPMTTAPEHNE